MKFKASSFQKPGTYIQLSAAAPEDGSKTIPTFSSVAYTGTKMRPEGSKMDIIVDLSGVSVRNPDGSVSILLNHNRKQLIGQAILQLSGDTITATGTITGENESAKEVLAHAKNGFNWQQSIGGEVLKSRLLRAGKKAVVNGHEVSGPVEIIEKILVDEISFVDGGADVFTSASIAAIHNPGNRSEAMLTFDEWLIENGVTDKESLSAEALATLESEYEAWKAAQDADDEPADDPPAADSTPVAAAPAHSDNRIEAAIAAERNRVRAHNGKLRTLCAAHDHPEFADRAISNDWSEQETLSQLLTEVRASRSSHISPRNPGVPPMDLNQVLEISMLRAQGVELKENEYDERSLKAADSAEYRDLGLHGLMYHAAKNRGAKISAMGMNTTKLRACFDSFRLQASSGPSTISVSGILSNLGNKFLLQGYEANPSHVDTICATANVKDFKQTSSYRLIDNGTLELVPPGGEIQHGSLTEQSYNNQVKTYAKMISIDRQNIINDDLGAFQNLNRQLGQSAFNQRERIVFSGIQGGLASLFYDDANKNIINVGATAPFGQLNPLSFDGLVLAEQRLTEQTDGSEEEYPIAVMGAYLVVSPQNSAEAWRLFSSSQLNETTSDNFPAGSKNIMENKYQPVVSNFLTGLAGADWYLSANPNNIASWEIAYLNGRRTPVVESSDMDFNQLGVQTRVIYDFGFALQDPRGSVLSVGA